MEHTKKKDGKDKDIEKSTNSSGKEKKKKYFITDKIIINPIKTFFSNRMLKEEDKK